MRKLLVVLAIIATGCTSVAAPESTSTTSRPEPVVPVAGTEGSNTGCGLGPAGSEPYQLTEVSHQFGLKDRLTGMHGHAAAWGDINSDGVVDLLVGTFADRPPENYLFRGAQGPSRDQILMGTGEGFTSEDLASDLARTSGAVFADLDGDGDLDLVVSRNSREEAGPGGVPTQVFENGGGILVATPHSFPASLGGRSIGVLDFDDDGRLDLFIVEDQYRGGSSRLFRNMGKFEFVDVTQAAGLPADVEGLGVAVADLGGDRLVDIFVSGSNRLFINTGGSFTEVDNQVFEWEKFGDEDDVAGVDVADIDLDGRADLIVGHHFNSTVDFSTEVAVRLYLNKSEGGEIRFEDVTERAGLTPLRTKAPHVEFADMNNDGLLDIVTSASANNGTEPAIFLGNGFSDGVPTFQTPDGLGSDQYWVTSPTVDLDGDGQLDMIAVEWYVELPSLLFKGSSPGNWVTVAFAEPVLAPGAMVAVYDSETLIGSRQVSASRGYSAGVESVAHFGLGPIEVVNVVVTLRDGSELLAEEVPANHRLLVGPNEVMVECP